MTNEQMLRKLANGELPCEVIASPEYTALDRTRLTAGTTLCIIPQETLRVRAGERGFVQVIDGVIEATLEEDEVFWVLPRRPA